jgi:hypothetical protein
MRLIRLLAAMARLKLARYSLKASRWLAEIRAAIFPRR